MMMERSLAEQHKARFIYTIQFIHKVLEETLVQHTTGVYKTTLYGDELTFFVDIL